MKPPRRRSGEPHADAWPLLVRFFFAQRAHLPTLAAELELSPAQCHLLHIIEPDRPVAMGRLAEAEGEDVVVAGGAADEDHQAVG